MSTGAGQVQRSGFVRQGRVIASFALGGSVLAGLTLGWVPALATVDVNAVGAAAGGILGVIANTRHLV